jgi:molybdate transport system substrate-binding protein
MKAIFLKSVGALVATMMLATAPVRAAEIKVLTAGVYKPVISAIQAVFEAAHSHNLVIVDGTAPDVVKRVNAGEAFDVVIITPDALDDLIAKGRVTSASRVPLARVGLGVMVKANAPPPEIGNVDALKKALTEATSIAFTDPGSGDPSGIYIDGLLKKLNLGDAVKAKLKLAKPGEVTDMVKRGNTALAIAPISEIVGVNEVKLVGPLPADLQQYMTFAAGVNAQAKEAQPATMLLQVLAGPAGAIVLKAKGMEPAGS